MLERVRDFLLRRKADELSRAAQQLRRPGVATATVGPTMPGPDQTIDIDALLGRKAVNLDTPELQRFISQKRVLITGAGGSIGSELCRQAARFIPARMILVERAENALFEIDRELRERWIGLDVRPCVADVTDARRIEAVFEEHRPDVVFHAAAHKHVPLMEFNPGEAIKNNVFGTLAVAEAARSHECEAFVLISTDKAVNPSSVMGATKRVAEMAVQAVASGLWPVTNKTIYRSSLTTSHRQPLTRFLAVRFGNVLGSSGSVVPIFKKQIAAGGPVTVTHPEMRRYFMTIPEATQLVMQAGAIGQGGEIFILDMGRPMRILDLARQMIRNAGLVEGQDIQIRVTGIRPGEKLFEELAGAEERTKATSHAKIRVWELPRVDPLWLDERLDELRHATDAPTATAKLALRRAVPEFASEATPRPSESPAVAA